MPASLDRVASKQQGLRLRLFGPPGAPSSASPLEREAVRAALAGSNFVKGTTDGGMFVAAIPYHGQVLVAVNRQPGTAEAVDTGNRGGPPAGGIPRGVRGLVRPLVSPP